MSTILDLVLLIEECFRQIIILNPLTGYFILFAIVFSESAFFPIAPFLPGDGLLFGVGILCANGSLHLGIVIPLLIVAGVLGNQVAYFLGFKFGPLIFERFTWINRKHYERAHQFYQQHGSRAFILSRYIPVVRALVPFVAGVARMPYRRFMKYNVVSVCIWVISITLIAYFLGHIPFIEQHYTLIILGAIVAGTIPLVVMSIRQAFKHSAKTT